MSLSKPSRTWRVVFSLLLVFICGLFLYGFWPVITGSPSPGIAKADSTSTDVPSASVHAVTVEAISLPIRAQSSGRLVAWHRATIRSEIGGRVTEHFVEEGEVIQKGDILVTLDSQEERIAVEEARADLLKAQARFAVEARPLPDGRDPDEGELAKVREAYRETQQGLSNGISTHEDVEAARRQYEAAQVRAGEKREDIQAAQTGLIAAEQALERATMRLEQTRVRAPFSGRAANVEIKTGDYAPPGEMLMTLLQDNRLKVEVDVLEGDVIGLERGATARVHIPALDGVDEAKAQFDGRIQTINPQVDPETGTARVTVSIPNSKKNLVSGLYANVQLETRRLNNQLVLPTDAILVRQGRELVFVVENERVQWTYVDVGARSGSLAAVTDGLQNGDLVAIEGHYALAHNAPVVVESVKKSARSKNQREFRH